VGVFEVDGVVAGSAKGETEEVRKRRRRWRQVACSPFLEEDKAGRRV